MSARDAAEELQRQQRERQAEKVQTAGLAGVSAAGILIPIALVGVDRGGGPLVMHEWWPSICSVLLGVTLGGCAPVTTPATWQPGNVQPLISGWQQYFAILWSVTRQDQGALIEGYIINNWGFAVREVQVLVNGYDSSGAQTGQVIAWGPNAIQPGDRVYFDVTVPAGSATYDVSVFSWKWTWPPSSGPGNHDAESWRTRHAGNDRSPVHLTLGSGPDGLDAVASAAGGVICWESHHASLAVLRLQSADALQRPYHAASLTALTFRHLPGATVL
jgi:hypothetical protein